MNNLNDNINYNPSEIQFPSVRSLRNYFEEKGKKGSSTLKNVVSTRGHLYHSLRYQSGQILGSKEAVLSRTTEKVNNFLESKSLLLASDKQQEKVRSLMTSRAYNYSLITAAKTQSPPPIIASQKHAEKEQQSRKLSSQSFNHHTPVQQEAIRVKDFFEDNINNNNFTSFANTQSIKEQKTPLPQVLVYKGEQPLQGELEDLAYDDNIGTYFIQQKPDETFTLYYIDSDLAVQELTIANTPDGYEIQSDLLEERISGKSLGELIEKTSDKLALKDSFLNPDQSDVFLEISVSKNEENKAIDSLPQALIYKGEQSLQGELEDLAYDDNIGTYFIQQKPDETFTLYYIDSDLAVQELAIANTPDGYEIQSDLLEERISGKSLGELIEKASDKLPLKDSFLSSDQSDVFLEDVNMASKKEIKSDVKSNDNSISYDPSALKAKGIRKGIARLDNKWVKLEVGEGDPEKIIELRNQRLLPQQIKACRDKISEKKEAFRRVANEQLNVDPNCQEVKRLAEDPNHLVKHEGGLGGAYHVKDENGETKFILKPIDEDVLCLNNSKTYATPWNDQEANHRVRKHIPLYEGAQSEVLASNVAEKMGLSNVTPKTVMVIVKSAKFNDIMDDVANLEVLEKEDEELLQQTGFIDKEKLCSAQVFVQGAKPLENIEQRMQQRNYSSDKIKSLFDQESFEQANIFTWVTYENDGHTGNYLATFKPNHEGKKKYFLTKIDNGLVFPDKNTRFKNQLSVFPNAKVPLSDKGKEIILKTDVLAISQQMRQLGKSEDSILAFKTRMEVLKKLATREDMTLEEIDMRMELLGSDTGKLSSPPMDALSLSLSNLTLAEIKELLTPTPILPKHWDQNCSDEVPLLGKYRLGRMVKQRRSEETQKKYELDMAIQHSKQFHPDIHKKLAMLENNGHLIPSKGGEGGAYFLKSPEDEKIHFVLKPSDEDNMSFNNRKGNASPYNDNQLFHRVHKDIPLGRTCQSEALSSDCAEILGLGELTPKTVLLTFTSNHFYDLLDGVPPDQKVEMSELLGSKVTTKLCSAQEFIHLAGAKELQDYLAEWEKEAGYDEKKMKELVRKNDEAELDNYTNAILQNLSAVIESKISLSDYQKLQIFSWTIYDEDGHKGNYIAYPKNDGSGQMAIKKIDNGFAWGDKNSEFTNTIMEWPQGQAELLDDSKKLIDYITSRTMRDQVIQRMLLYKFPPSAIEAFEERMNVLQELSNRRLSVREINIRMSLLGRQDELQLLNPPLQEFKTSVDLALNQSLSLSEMEKIIQRMQEEITADKINYLRKHTVKTTNVNDVL